MAGSHVGGFRAEHRSRGVKVRTLVLPEVHRTSLEAGLPDWPTLKAEDLAVGVTADGKVFVICTEGVGWEVKDEFKVDVWGSGANSFSMFPVARITLSKREVLEGMESGEEVDLADWVRAFGDRLECNFGIWFDTLEVAS
jgi:hypothetical protein